MELVESEWGHPKLAFENYSYIQQQELTGGVISYGCEGRRRHGSKAKVEVLGEEIVGRVNEHNHEVDVANKEVIEIRSIVKRRADTTEETSQVIITQTVGR